MRTMGQHRRAARRTAASPKPLFNTEQGAAIMAMAVSAPMIRKLACVSNACAGPGALKQLSECLCFQGAGVAIRTGQHLFDDACDTLARHAEVA